MYAWHMGAESKVVLVTGASTGIGLAICRELLEQGMRVAASARASSLDRLRALGWHQNPQCLLVELDLDLSDQRRNAIATVLDHWGRLDVLVNNAGICYRGVVEQLSHAEESRQMNINYLAAIDLTRWALPQMRSQRSGHVINISSTAGMVAMPTMSAYSASKFALEGASEALWYEMRPWGVHVTLVQPGFVRSPSFRNAIFAENAKTAAETSSDPYFRYYRHMLGLIERLMTRSPTRPQDIARLVARRIRRPGNLRVYATWDARAFNLLRRLLPQRLYHWLLYRGLPGVKDWVDP